MSDQLSQVAEQLFLAADNCTSPSAPQRREDPGCRSTQFRTIHLCQPQRTPTITSTSTPEHHSPSTQSACHSGREIRFHSSTVTQPNGYWRSGPICHYQRSILPPRAQSLHFGSRKHNLWSRRIEFGIIQHSTNESVDPVDIRQSPAGEEQESVFYIRQPGSRGFSTRRAFDRCEKQR